MRLWQATDQACFVHSQKEAYSYFFAALLHILTEFLCVIWLWNAFDMKITPFLFILKNIKNEDSRSRAKTQIVKF